MYLSQYAPGLAAAVSPLIGKQRVAAFKAGGGLYNLGGITGVLNANSR